MIEKYNGKPKKAAAAAKNEETLKSSIEVVTGFN